LWIRAQSYAGLGELACVNGQLDEGLAYFKQVLTFAGDDNLPPPIITFVLTGIAGVYIKQEKYESALELLALVLQYPMNYIAMSEDRARKMLDEASAKLDASIVQSAMEQSKSLVLQDVIAGLLTEG
jgi:hypothetical protein